MEIKPKSISVAKLFPSLELNFYNPSFNIFEYFNITLRSGTKIQHPAIKELRFFTK